MLKRSNDLIYILRFWSETGKLPRSGKGIDCLNQWRIEKLGNSWVQHVIRNNNVSAELPIHKLIGNMHHVLIEPFSER